MRRGLLLVLLLLGGCRQSAAEANTADSEVRLVSATPTFDGEGKGSLDLMVEVQPLGNDAVAESVDWELWLNTRHFASGVNAVGEKLSGAEVRQVHVVVPLVFRGVQTNLEPLLITIGVRGGLRVKTGRTEARYPFERVSKQSVPNSPVLQSGFEDE